MTIEEKAKAYDEVFEKARKRYEYAKKEDNPIWCSYEELFPELAESEDERIRKALICHLKADKIDFVSNGVTKDECLAWLEKQKEVDILDDEERAFADNVDAFRESCDEAYRTGYNEGVRVEREKWLEKKKESLHIPETCKENAKSFTDEDERIRKDLIEFLDNVWHLGRNADFDKWGKADCADWIAWLEKQKERKPIDEKAVDEISKGVRKKWALDFINYLDNNHYEGKMGVSNGECADIENAFISADWDKLYRYYNKYLQKPAEWSEEDEKPFNDVLSGLKYAYEDLRNNKSFDSAKDIKEAFDWMQARVKSLRPQPKVEWSEEDEKIQEGIMQFLYAWRSDTKITKWLDWLKSLKPQPKQEWSEEDDRIMNDIKCFIQLSLNADSAVCPGGSTTKKEAITWLKSLRNRQGWKPNKDKVSDNLHPEEMPLTPKECFWKPSEEQMEALDKIIGYTLGNKRFYPQDLPVIESLYNDLKKLKED